MTDPHPTTFMLSNGTLAGLTGISDYKSLDELQWEFVQYAIEHGYDNWVEAWHAFWPEEKDMTEQLEVKMTPVESSTIGAIGYSGELNALVIAYRENRVYAYYDADKGEVDKILASDSIGKYVNSAVWYDDHYARLKNVRIMWSKSNEGVRTGLEFNMNALKRSLGNAMRALDSGRHGNVDLDDVSIILPSNTPDGFLEVARHWVDEELGIDPLYAIVVGDTKMDNLMQVSNLEYSVAFDDPRPQPSTPKVADTTALPDPQPSLVGGESTWGKYLGGAQDTKQEQEAATTAETRPSQQLRDSETQAAIEKMAGNGKNPRYRVRVEGHDLEDWIMALAYVHAKLNERIGGGLFVSLPYSAPEELVDLLRDAGIEVYDEEARPTPQTVEVGVYTE